MGLADFLGGLALFALCWGAGVATAAVLISRRMSGLAGAARVVAFGLLTTFVVVEVHVVLLAAGALTRVTPAALALTLFALVWRFVPRVAVASSSVRARSRACLPTDSRPSKLMAITIVALAAMGAVAVVFAETEHQLFFTDATTFHLPNVAAWIHAGSAWRLDQFEPDLSNATYPQNGDVLQLAATLPWHATFLARVLAVPWWLLTGAGVYALARELGAARAASVIAAVALLSMPIVAVSGLEAVGTDSYMLACFAGGLVFLLRHRRTGQASDLVLAGAGLGLSAGTKWYGVSTVLALVVLWLIAGALTRIRPRALLRAGLVMTGLITIAGGFWLLRNLVETGNPLFPVRVAPFGVTVFDAPPDLARQRFGASILDYGLDGGVWRRIFLPGFTSSLGLAGLALVVGVSAAAAHAAGLWRRFPSAQRPVRIFVLVIATLLLVGVYLKTPYSALGPPGNPVAFTVNIRYVGPALVIAAALSAWAATRLGASGRVLEVLLFVGALDALRRTTSGLDARALLIGAALVSMVVIAAWAGVRALRKSTPSVRRTLVIGSAVLAAGAIGGLVLERRVDSRNYEDRVLDWFAFHAPSGAHVGLAGRWSPDSTAPVLPAFGPRLGNRVSYVGRFVDGILRVHPDRAAFVRDLRARHFSLLVVGRASSPLGNSERELSWARSAGYRETARSKRFLLLRAP